MYTNKLLFFIFFFIPRGNEFQTLRLYLGTVDEKFSVRMYKMSCSRVKNKNMNNKKIE